jgi:hypothetical protein
VREIPFLGDQPSVPAQQSIWRNDRVQFEQRLASHCLGFPRQQRSLCVGEPDPLAAQPVFEQPILGLKEFDDDQLVAMNPTTQNHQQKRESWWHGAHATSLSHTSAELLDTTGLKHMANSRPQFADCAARYLAESQHKRSVDLLAWHIRLLLPYLRNLEANRVHDRTLEPFIADGMAAGVTATTINRSLEVVRTILNRAARAYRDDDCRPWLDTLPPVITMLPETPRLPYPITWEEQDRLFPKLSARLVSERICW